MKTEVLSKEELIELLASCNNLIIRGQFLGEDAIELGQLMQDINVIIDHLAQELHRD